MSPENVPLSPEEKRQAYKLWDELMFAANQADFDSARELLQAASAPVLSAIVLASISRQTHLHPPQRDDNPFQ